MRKIFVCFLSVCSLLSCSKPQAAEEASEAVACGAFHPERDDDLAWENDVVAFRAYGPAIERSGQRLYGYDIFLKRDTAGPILPLFYEQQCSPENWAKVRELRQEGRDQEAREFEQSFTYHVDHGYGMDCYAVGPTLGAGVSALLADDGEIAYPWCYDEAEIIENGPERFLARLTFKPMAIGADTVVETRWISLVPGSNLNLTKVVYEGLTQPRTAVVGIVLHDDTAPVIDPGKKYMAYIDPTQGEGNGQVYMGAKFPQAVDSIAVAGDGPVHVLAYQPYAPGDTLTYYWGYGWERGNMPSMQAWTEYLSK